MLKYEKNCFLCSGKKEDACSNYYIGHDKICVYRDVANNDLEKHKCKDKHTTLTTMLNDYLLIKK